MAYTAKVIAVLGRTLRAGRWKLADDSLVIAIFGRCVLDLSRAYVDEEDDHLSMTVFCLFGSVSVVLPPGCDVEPSGIALLASSEVEIPSDKIVDITQDVLAPLDISWIAMFGRVRINELSPEVEPGAITLVVDALAPPAVEVFDSEAAASAPQVTPDPATTPAAVATAGIQPAEAPAAEVAPAAPDPAEVAQQEADSAAEVAAEQAALQDEIAQWRAETGRPEPERDSAEDAEADPSSDADEPVPDPVDAS